MSQLLKVISLAFHHQTRSGNPRLFISRSCSSHANIITYRINNICNNVRLFSTTNENSVDGEIKADTRATNEDNENELSWDNFDYSDAPKIDPRFSKTSTTSTTSIESIQQCVSSEELQQIAQNESNEDYKLHKKFQEKNKALENMLDLETVDKCIETLRPYVQEKRCERMESILNQRTKNIRFLFENPSNPR